MTATREGVATRRSAAMGDILKNRNAEIDRELKEGGTPEGVAVLEGGDSPAPAGSLVMPEGTDPTEWAALSDEAKAGLIEADQERKRVEAEAASNKGEGETDDQKAAREAKEQEEAERKAAEEAAVQAAAAGGKKVKLKVDGKEVEVDEAEVLEAGRRALQKETAADRRLEEASRTSAEAARLLKAAQDTIAAAARGGGPAQTEGVDSPSGKDGKSTKGLSDEDLTKAVKAIQYGSEAEAKQALQDVIVKAAAAGDSDELTLARVGEMLDFREARSWAETEYKDVLGDPNTRKLFLLKERELRAAGDARPYRELYGVIGEEVRGWRKSLGSTPPNPATGGKPRSDAHERKTTLRTVPVAAGRREPPPPQPTERPHSETIASMAASRGKGRVPPT